MNRALLALALGLASCGSDERGSPHGDRAPTGDPGERPLLAAFLIEDGTYNSELTAPMDILHHTPFHAPPGIEVVTVARSLAPIRTFEGLVIRPDHDYASAPEIDVLVVPSAERHVAPDFDDPALVEFVRARGRTARWVMSLCDGAFVLGRAGLLDGKTCTTFPGDLETLRERFPAARVVDGVTFAVDGGLITGVGGARSFAPALWLVERLYGELPARGVARGMVIDWHLESERYVDVDDADPDSVGYRVGDRIDPDVTVLDADGAPRRLLDVVPDDARVVVLTLFGGGDAGGEARRGGLWCEDSLNQLPVLRHLMHRFARSPVGFVGVACPPALHDERFGHAKGAFQGDGDPAEIRRFVEATERAVERGVVPFEEVHYDPTFRLSRDVVALPPRDGDPAWVGRFRPRDEWQVYGTPCVWILSRDGVVLMPPFHGNNFEKEGVLRYSAGQLGFAIERALTITGPADGGGG